MKSFSDIYLFRTNINLFKNPLHSRHFFQYVLVTLKKHIFSQALHNFSHKIIKLFFSIKTFLG